MSSYKPRCEICGFDHRPNNPALKLVFDGEDYYAPFFCLCCGKRICDQQFAFGRACGPCDVGACQRGNSSFRPAAEHLPSSWVLQKQLNRELSTSVR